MIPGGKKCEVFEGLSGADDADRGSGTFIWSLLVLSVFSRATLNEKVMGYWDMVRVEEIKRSQKKKRPLGCSINSKSTITIAGTCKGRKS